MPHKNLPQFRVEPNGEKLSLYGITLAQLQGKIAGANRSFAVGRVRDDGEQRSLVAGQTLQQLADIGNLVLTARDGRPVYVRDVADIVLATSPNETRVATVERSADGLVRVAFRANRAHLFDGAGRHIACNALEKVPA